MPATTGVTSETVKNIICDAGAVFLNYGLAGERMLGATDGGAKFTIKREIKEIAVDGVKGKVKGLRRITEENADLEITLKEMSAANFKLALAGSTLANSTRTSTPAEYLGLGTAAAETFTFANAPIIGSEKFFVNGLPVAWVSGVQYTITGTAMTVIGLNTLALADKVVASYQYNAGGAATYDSITSTASIALTDYQTNVALVAQVSGTALPIVIVLSNILSDGDFSMELKDKDEGTLGVTMSAHYDPAALATPIYEIRYPKIA